MVFIQKDRQWVELTAFTAIGYLIILVARHRISLLATIKVSQKGLLARLEVGLTVQIDHRQ